MQVGNSNFSTILYFFFLSFIQCQLYNATVIVAKFTCQSTNSCIKKLFCDIIVTQMEFYKLTNKQKTMRIVLIRSIISYFTQNLQNGSLIPPSNSEECRRGSQAAKGSKLTIRLYEVFIS